jgi:transcriptional regulator MraZ
MTQGHDFLLGEYPRTLDERYRLTLPSELTQSFAPEIGQNAQCILAKERSGCLSLWPADRWEEKLNAGVELVRAKMRSGRLEGRVEEVQMLGRLLSTRHRNVQLAERARLVIPEGFREFLGVEPGAEVIVVGAAVCVELWRPSAWFSHLESSIPEFRKLFDQLSS